MRLAYLALLAGTVCGCGAILGLGNVSYDGDAADGGSDHADASLDASLDVLADAGSENDGGSMVDDAPFAADVISMHDTSIPPVDSAGIEGGACGYVHDAGATETTRCDANTYTIVIAGSPGAGSALFAMSREQQASWISINTFSPFSVNYKPTLAQTANGFAATFTSMSTVQLLTFIPSMTGWTAPSTPNSAAAESSSGVAEKDGEIYLLYEGADQGVYFERTLPSPGPTYQFSATSIASYAMSLVNVGGTLNVAYTDANHKVHSGTVDPSVSTMLNTFPQVSELTANSGPTVIAFANAGLGVDQILAVQNTSGGITSALHTACGWATSQLPLGSIGQSSVASDETPSMAALSGGRGALAARLSDNSIAVAIYDQGVWSPLTRVAQGPSATTSVSIAQGTCGDDVQLAWTDAGQAYRLAGKIATHAGEVGVTWAGLEKLPMITNASFIAIAATPTL